MIPPEILSEFHTLNEAQLDKQARWKPGDHHDRAPRWDWSMRKLLEIIEVQEQRIDALEREIRDAGGGMTGV